jgi:HK97 family phage prohead protease
VLRFDDPSPDARTIVARVIPLLGETAIVDDGAGPYAEKFIHGVFKEQIEEAQTKPLRIWLDIAHRRNLIVGHAVRLHESEAGLYADFALHPGAAGDQVLAAIRRGELNGISAQVTPLRSRTVDGVVRREKGHLVGVALVAKPAYAGAEVVSIRKALPGEQAAPATAHEFQLWNLEALDNKARAIACRFLDNALDDRSGRTRAYTDDPRYQRVIQLRKQLADSRAEIEPAIANRTEAVAEPDARQPKILRRLAPDPIVVV